MDKLWFKNLAFANQDTKPTTIIPKWKKMPTTEDTTEIRADPFTKIFECPVCFERLKPPITLCINGHGVCNDCRNKLIKCPTCKCTFSNNKNTLLEQIMEEGVFQCKYREKGCRISMKYAEIEEHESKRCDFRTIECEIKMNDEQCKKNIEMGQYYWHVIRDHNQGAEVIYFKKENERRIDVTQNVQNTKIMKIKNYVFLEHVKVDKINKKFYVAYQYIGNVRKADRHVFTLTIRNGKNRKIGFKNNCVPLMQNWDEVAQSERCLVMDLWVLNPFKIDDEIHYSFNIRKVYKNWFIEFIHTLCECKYMCISR